VIDEREQIVAGLAELGLPESVCASEQQVSSLLRYLELLEETNRSFNLTRIPRADFVSLHLIDSLSCLLEVAQPAPRTIIDVGTGAGFPGVPLAALLPESTVTVLDATAKKVRFVGEAAAQSGITNIRAVHGRAELIARTPEYRGRFELVVARAVAALKELVPLLLPLAAPGARVVAMKGSGYREELEGIEQVLARNGGVLERIRTFTLPGTDRERALIVVRKR
jgi:16S rRNA (guanine527-N7)-methyltransferase